MKEKYSLLKTFGSLPVHPDVFETLDKKLKHLGECEEGQNFCIMCGTLTPSTPRSHHTECGWYKDLDTYEEQKSKYGECPSCGEDDSLFMKSSYEQRISRIECSDCGYLFGGSMCEEDLEDEFFRKYKK